MRSASGRLETRRFNHGEVVAALESAVSSSDIGSSDIAEPLALLDRINAMLYRMTRR